MIDTNENKKKAITKPISESEVTDVDLGFVEKKKFRINGDNTRILELNVSDMNLTARFSETYPKLVALVNDVPNKVDKLSSDSTDEALAQTADLLKSIDDEMRKHIDYIFDSNVSEICAPSGNMFDPVNGEYRFEHIIKVVAQLYTTGLDKELEALKKKATKHTVKYTKKDK